MPEDHSENCFSFIADRLRMVQERAASACNRAGRNRDEVTVIPVSKTKPFAAVLTAHRAGAVDFGENYVQELSEKIREAEALDLRPQIRWHMIGHLQRNKVKYLIGRTALIHSVDSEALAQQIEKEAAKKECCVRVLLEVNAAGEETKWGFSPDEVISTAERISILPHLRVLGLMTSAPYTENPDSNRPYFRKLRELAFRMKEAGLIPGNDELFKIPVLSMGMSCDFEAAVEEGATLIRVGTEIFGARTYHD